MVETQNGRLSSPLATSITSSMVMGALLSVLGWSLAEKQADQTERVKALESAQEEAAYWKGVADQRLDEISAGVSRNSASIVDESRRLDTNLQREIGQVNATTLAEIDGADARIQAEIATLVQGLRDRVTALEGLQIEVIRNKWTVDDQREFERKLGLTLEAGP